MARQKSNKVDWVGRAASVTTVLLLLAAAGGLVVGYRAMESRVGQVKSGPVRVEFNWPPLAGQPATLPDGKPNTWLSEPFRRQLVMLAQTVLSENPFDRSSLERCHLALMDSGWFRQIKLIHRSNDGVVRVEGDWRAPAAVVRFEDVDYLVSADGERLPVEYKPDASRMRVVTNPYKGPPERFGEKWIGGDVQAALKLLAHLQTTGAYAQVTGVDAGQYVASKKLVILTDQGNRVVWGAAPGEFAASEPATEVKMKWLTLLATSPDFGRRIDAGKPVIDLTNPRGIMIDVSAQPSPIVPTNQPAATESGVPPAGRLAARPGG
jgi:hypothetical protein